MNHVWGRWLLTGSVLGAEFLGLTVDLDLRGELCVLGVGACIWDARSWQAVAPARSPLVFSGEHTIARWLRSQVAVWNPGSFASQLCGPRSSRLHL